MNKGLKKWEKKWKPKGVIFLSFWQKRDSSKTGRKEAFGRGSKSFQEVVLKEMPKKKVQETKEKKKIKSGLWLNLFFI